MVYRNIYIFLKGSNIWGSEDKPALEYTGDLFEYSIYGDQMRDSQFFNDHDYDPQVDLSIGCSCVSRGYCGLKKVKDAE